MKSQTIKLPFGYQIRTRKWCGVVVSLYHRKCFILKKITEIDIEYSLFNKYSLRYWAYELIQAYNSRRRKHRKVTYIADGWFCPC